MKRYERTRILIEGDMRLAQRISQEIETLCTFEVLDNPHEELVMVQVRESARNSLFYLGEALMCSCQVRIGEAVGLGMALGDRRDFVYNLALIDAAFKSADEKFPFERWEENLRAEAERIEARQAKVAARMERTRVDFSTMEADL